MLLEFVLFSIPAVLLACGTLPPGQEAQVSIRGEGLATIPLELAYSTEQMVKQNFPLIAPTPADAVKNLRKYVKKAVTTVIKKEARNNGMENLVSDIANQIKPKVYYSPMFCSRAGAAAQAPAGAGYACVVQNNIVTNVAYSPALTDKIPEPYQQFTVVLSISNAGIGGWNRATWEQTLAKVERQLATGKYGDSFRSVRLTQL